MKSKVNLIFFGLIFCVCAHAFSPSKAGDNDSLIFLQKSGYVVWYNVTRSNPAVVVWNLSMRDLGRNKRPQSQSFRVDPLCPRPRAKSNDFRGTGYQRGHMCPSADKSADSHMMLATFFMSNVCPMTPKLNMVQWAQAEDYCRLLARCGHRMTVYAGTIFSTDKTNCLGTSLIQIPDSFFRAVIVHDDPRLSVYWLMANDTIFRAESTCRVSQSRLNQSLRNNIKNILDKINLL